MKKARKARRQATISADVDKVHSVCRMPRTVERCIGGERPDCPSTDVLHLPFSRLRAKFGHERPILDVNAICIIHDMRSKYVRACNDKSDSKTTASYCIVSRPLSRSGYNDQERRIPTHNY